MDNGRRLLANDAAENAREAYNVDRMITAASAERRIMLTQSDGDVYSLIDISCNLVLIDSLVLPPAPHRGVGHPPQGSAGTSR